VLVEIRNAYGGLFGKRRGRYHLEETRRRQKIIQNGLYKLDVECGVLLSS
jgi:hypothetical protein